MRGTLCAAALLAATLGSAAPSLAWGAKTHTLVVYNAIELLPPGPLRDFMEANSKRATGYSMAPDFQLCDGLGGELERADHYLNLERLGERGVWERFPRTRNDALRFCIEHGIRQEDLGFAPWRIETSYLDLAASMASDPDGVALRAGLLAHYAADATMPLHTTVNYDGIWPEPGTPSTERRHRGIHFLYEITFVEDSGHSYAQEALARAAPARAPDDVLERAYREVLAAHDRVDDLYACADRHPEDLEAWSAELGDLTREQLARASSLIASLWLKAWETAGVPTLEDND